MPSTTLACYSCGHPVTGAYCAHCGSPRRAPKDSWLSYVASYLQFEEVSQAAALTWRIFRSPKKATIHLYETLPLNVVIRFVISAAAFAGLAGLSGIFTAGNPVAATVFNLFFNTLLILISFPIIYYVLRFKNPHSFTRGELFKISALVGGYMMIIIAFDIIALNINLWLTLPFTPYLIYLDIYFVKVYKWFTRLSLKSLLLRLVIIGLVQSAWIYILGPWVTQPIASVLGVHRTSFKDPQNNPFLRAQP